MLSGKSFLITGGTGSFGNTLVRRLLNTEISEIVVFSRDEAKQHFMKQEIVDPRMRFILGDVRNFESVTRALHDIDYVFHAAALKHVPASEASPWEFVQTNIQGSHNLLRAVSYSRVSRAVFLSTDKAVYPLNSMGMTKALMEKLVRSDDYPSNVISVITRYGNVIGSRGSVIPQFIDSIKKHNSVNITNPEMTRFMMTLEESVDLVLFALEKGERGDLFVQKSPAARVDTIVDALSLLLKRDDVNVQNIGIRPGEKIHETLLSAEERTQAIEHARFFQVPRRSQIILPSRAQNAEYTSENTSQLSVIETANLLRNIPVVSASI